MGLGLVWNRVGKEWGRVSMQWLRVSMQWGSIVEDELRSDKTRHLRLVRVRVRFSFFLSDFLLQ